MAATTRSTEKKSESQIDKIISVLYATDIHGGLTQAEIERVTKIPKTSANRALKKLVKELKVFKSKADNSEKYSLIQAFRAKLDREYESEHENDHQNAA